MTTQLHRLNIVITLISLTLFSLQSNSAVTIPQNLNQVQRVQLLETFGFGSTGKVLSNPYPIGGYSGVEIGMSVEFIPIDALKTIDSSVDNQNNLVFPSFTLGKGLYNNFDLYLDFVPFLEKTSVSKFGALLRWGFYNGVIFPINLSLSLHANSVNISNKITTSSFGTTLIASFNLSNFSFYSGIGKSFLNGKFIGDASGTDNAGITDSKLTEKEQTEQFQWLLGLTYSLPETLQPWFIAIEMDYFKEPIYSAKIGIRY